MNNQKLELLGKLYINFKRSEKAYKNYLNDGNIFLHARILKECNSLLKILLIEDAYILNESLRNDAIELISHYDIWTEKWNDLEKNIKPKSNDPFVFKNDHVFPKEAERRLKEEFLRLKKD